MRRIVPCPFEKSLRVNRMFQRTRRKRDTGREGPFRGLDGPTKVERHILSLPFSREETRLSWLNRSVALYCLAFGQPRQDDLLALLDQVREEIAPEVLAQLQISLRLE